MAYENINFKKNHCVVRDGYYYFIEEANNVLYKKASDGKVIFTYPIIDLVGPEIRCLAFDGHYFWALQDGPTSADIVIKKYYIENFVVHLEEALAFNNSPDNSFSVDTFSLEYYNTTLACAVSKDDTSLMITDYSDRVTSGTILTLGPNDDGLYEDVTVTGTLSTSLDLGLDFFIQYDYPADTKVYFANNLWLINKYAYKVLDDGALYQISLPKKEIISISVDEDFASIIASCFYTTVDARYVIVSWETNLKFLNLDTLVTDKTMTVDNIKIDKATIIPIIALQVDGDTIFRLQREATYFDEDFTFSTLNYQPSPLRPFVDSVSVDVYPKILPSNGINVADVEAVVQDQYAAAMQIKPVTFQDTDDVGFMTVGLSYTNLAGVAKSYYKAGIVPNTVYIMATATQYD